VILFVPFNIDKDLDLEQIMTSLQASLITRKKNESRGSFKIWFTRGFKYKRG